MLAGIILLVCGLLIALYPPLLSLIIASLLITSGVITLLIAYQNRRLPPGFENPILRIFFRL
jgi:uncharacterized membrane protein HdeD (DUF308 family)